MFGNVGRLGNGLTIGTGKALNGTATGTGKMIGDFFKFLRMAAVLAILATLSALTAFTPATFNARVFFAARNGAVIALNTATFVALAYNLERTEKTKKTRNCF